MPVEGRIFHIARSSVHDGPGIRTVVYFKGCNLRCLWCHNPEGFLGAPQLLFQEPLCIRCGTCAAVCPAHHSLEGGVHRFAEEGCRACGECAKACPTSALSVAGRAYSVCEVLREIQKDKAYFARSGGGVTLSGGECLLQLEFYRTLCEALRAEGISVLTETALNVPRETVSEAALLSDLFYVDVKHFDTQKHEQYTGVPNARILENLTALCALHSNVTVRVPLIPGVNDGETNLSDTVSFASQIGARGVQLLRYNPLAEAKYRQCGRPFVSFANDPQPPETMDELCLSLNRGLRKDGFVWWKK